MTYHCEIHNKDFNGPNSRGSYWHVINYANKEFCNKPAAELEGNLGPEDRNPKTSEEFLPNEQKDERSRKIERQHSQTTAIMALELAFKVDPEAFKKSLDQTTLRDMIKSYTDYFAKDVDNAVD